MSRTSARLLLGLAAGLVCSRLLPSLRRHRSLRRPRPARLLRGEHRAAVDGRLLAGLVEKSAARRATAPAAAPDLGLPRPVLEQHCLAVNACGGPGQRACCITETRWDTNPLPASGGCQYDATYKDATGSPRSPAATVPDSPVRRQQSVRPALERHLSGLRHQWRVQVHKRAEEPGLPGGPLTCSDTAPAAAGRGKCSVSRTGRLILAPGFYPGGAFPRS